MKKDLQFAVAQLRHAYKQLAAEGGNRKRFADGLIAPQIRRIENVLRKLDSADQPDTTTALKD
jgi:hypothetical protein